MSSFRIALAIVSAIVLFLYGLGAFSEEIQKVGGTSLKSWLERHAKSRWRGLVLGAVATAIVQSSSAVASLAVALVDAGVMSFRASVLSHKYMGNVPAAFELMLPALRRLV